MFTNVTNYSNNENLEAREEIICANGTTTTRTYYVERNTPQRVQIPTRETALVLDLNKIAELQQWHNELMGKFQSR